MDFHQLLPSPEVVALDAMLQALCPHELAPADRPFTVVNFVVGADGHVTFDGRSGAFGDDGDSAMFHGLREQFDAVLAGTGTLRVERYGPLVATAEAQKRRSERGLAPQPLACVITRSGEIPADIPLFADPQSRVVVFTPAPMPDPGWQAQVEQVPVEPGGSSITAALRHLRRQHDVRSLLCEGGPTLFGAMLHEQVVDELFLTLAPKLAGGGPGLTMSAGAQLAEPRTLRLRWLLERNDSVYLRYTVG